MRSRKIAVPMVLLLLLSAGSLLAQSRPVVPITVSVDTTSRGTEIPQQFSGLSFGTTSLRGGKSGYFFDSSSTQVLTLFRSLGIRSLRIGGTSVDTNTGNYIPSDPDIDALFRFASTAGVSVIYSLRLENGDPSQDAAAAQYISQNYAPLLTNFAIGNEPNLYKDADPKITNYSSYLSDWRSFADTVSNAVPGAIFGGPDSDSSSNGNSWGTRFASDEADAGNVKPIYFHYYVGGSSSGQTVQQLIDNLLSAYWVKTDYPTEFGQTGSSVLALNLPYRFTEADGFYTGGGSGVAGGDNCFATALFAVDFMHWWAENKISGVNFHTSMWKYNGTFYPDANGNYQIYPVGYGIKAFDLGGHGYVEPVTITNPNGSNVTAHAVGDSQYTYVTIVNKTHSPYLNSVDAAVTIQLNGVAAASAASIALSGDQPGDGASLTATLGGSAIPDDGAWQGRWTPLAPESNGTITVTVPSATAAIVKIRAAGEYAGPIQIAPNGALQLVGVRESGASVGGGFGNEHNSSGQVWINAQTPADAPNSPPANWTGWTNLAAGVNARGGAAVGKNLDGTLAVFVPTATGDVYYNLQSAPNGAWGTWVDMGSSSKDIKDLKTAHNSDGSITVFGIGPNGDVWYSVPNVAGVGWSSWTDLSGEQVQPGFAVTQNLDGDLEVFGVDRRSNVWTDMQTAGGAWSGWNPLYGASLQPRLAVASDLDGSIELFGVDSEGNVSRNVESIQDNSWSGWSRISGKRIKPGFVVGQNQDGRLAILGVEAGLAEGLWGVFDPHNGNGNVWAIAQATPGGQFTGEWTNLGAVRIDAPLVVGNTADGRMQLFAVGPNSDVWSNWQTSANGAWAGWSDFGGRGVEFYPAMAAAPPSPWGW